MRLRALKDLPNGVKAGETYDEQDVMGRILIRLGVACEATDATPAPPARRPYRRRDLQAED